MRYKIEVRDKKEIFDAVGEGVKKDILDLNIKGIKEVSFIQTYLFEGTLSKDELTRIGDDLLHDPITQEYKINSSFVNKAGSDCHIVEIAYNPGVMDPVEESTLKGIRDLGVKDIDSVRTVKKYVLTGNVSNEKIRFISEKLLFNKIIEHPVGTDPEANKHIPEYKFKITEVDLLNSGDKDLIEISKKGQLFLNLEEMQTIKKYYSSYKRRNPTDCELETIAQTWSEHCKHKTFRGFINHNGKVINNLLKSTVMRVTRELDKKWCVSVFKDNAGIIEFDDKYDICFKVETHNHPSALEPYGGAGTGIGGVIRDTLGTGLGAKPILNTDIFCFGPPDLSMRKLHKGTLHPKRVMKGVVGGVRDYGNRMGIPTSNGAILFDERYIGNPLVYCGNVGIIPKNKAEKRTHPGELIVVVGGRTGCDGIHGATFSSGELTEESEAVSNQAVQIGNPIAEKKVTDTLIQARDKNLYTAITDCGAGGLSSAVGEMGESIGAEVHLDKVPLKYRGLSYTEIWISEAQERMVMSVSKKNIKKVLKIFSDENVEATVIGEFTDTKRLELFYEGNKVADLDMKFLHRGDPKTHRKSVWKKKKTKDPVISEPKSFNSKLKKILSSWNVCSKEWVIRQYDHEVQGGSVLKPLQGPECDGPGDAAVTRPLLHSKKGIAVSNGINFLYGLIDPYWMAASCIDEALRQIVAVGGDIDRVALLDNFCWGNTNRPETLGELVRSAQACYDIAKGFGVPFISGKDSLNNEYKTRNKTISIPPTLLISAIGLIADIEKTISMDFKSTGNRIYVVGDTYNEMGGSHYLKIHGEEGSSVPRVNVKKAKKLMNALTRAIVSGNVVSCHDCSEGGIAVSVAEMAFAGGIGVDVTVKGIAQGEPIKRNDILLFSESNSRFIVEVPKSKRFVFEKLMAGHSIGLIGETKEHKLFRVEGLENNIIINESLTGLKNAWQRPFSKW